MKNDTITVTDGKGNVHNVIAVKPYSSHPADNYLLIVVHATGRITTPFVVHTMNVQTGGFSNGAYCPDMLVALAVFNNR